MRSLSILVFGLAATTASAQVPDTHIIAGAASQGLGVDNAYARDESVSNPPTLNILDEPNGDFRAMAVGDNGGIWVLHSTLDTLSVGLFGGGYVSYDISGTASDWSDMVATPSGRVFLSTFSGNVYEVDTSNGTLSSTPYNQTLAANTTLTNLATLGNTLYLATANYIGSTFVAIRYDVETQASIGNQPLPYYRGHTFWVFDNGDVLVNDNRDGPWLTRQTPAATSVWFRSFDFTADATVADDGSLWVLTTNDQIIRLNASTGVELDMGPFNIKATNHNAMTAFEAASLLNVEYPSTVADSCPDNPSKFAPGVCGCDYYDVPGLTFPEGNPGTGCVHITADYDYSGTIGDGAYVMANATVGANANIEQDAIVGVNAIVQAGANVGIESLVSRGAQLSPNAYLSRNVVIGRDVTIGSGASIAAYSTIGYASQVPANAQLLGGSVIGNQCDLGTGTFTMGVGSRDSSVIGRGVTFSNGAVIGGGVVVGPDSTFGDNFAAGHGTRLRKNISAGPNVSIGTDVRVGREVAFIGDNTISKNARLGTSATVAFDNCIDVGQVVARGVTVDDQTCPTD